MFDDIDNQIKSAKEILKKKSKDYIENFNNIKNYINIEIQKIKRSKDLNQPIIPEINFDSIEGNNEELIKKVKQRGCVIVRNVFNEQVINTLNRKLEEYINTNDYYTDQKKKSDLDKYFSDLKSGKPQIFGLYWSKTQIEIRHSEQMAKVKKWLNNLWVYENDEYKVFDPNRELSYADRVRRREPGDDTLGLSPHCDAGSVERWIDSSYQKIYKDIFSDNFRNYDPFDAKYRDRVIEFESPAVALVKI